jgi:hypothetical protein
MNQAQKTPIARSLESFAGRKAELLDQQMGWELPCHVVTVVSSGIVTVAFDLTNIPYTIQNITVPVLMFEYVRFPIQAGCKGRTITADAYLGGVSGLGGGIADLTRRPNLSNLCFMPIGNTNFSATDDPNAVVIYGPTGAIIRTTAKDSTLTVKSGQITAVGSGPAQPVKLADGSVSTVFMAQ